MKIFFHTPFKPLTHPAPSGDLTIATGLLAFLRRSRHDVLPVPAVRSRWVYWRPWAWPAVLADYRRAVRMVESQRPHLWITYHSYFKAPDVLGPAVCRAAGLPYVIFQGIYSTKRRRHVKSWPGFLLNRHALAKAHHVFTNKKRDWTNLQRIVPGDRLTYLRPGLEVKHFTGSLRARQRMRQAWQVGNAPVILTAAMFRRDVKTQGLVWLIRCLGRLEGGAGHFVLVVAGDGREKSRLLRCAEKHLPGRHRFLGRVPRDRMADFYSAGDVFAFPGINESLGMVYLEAQACGLPVVAFCNAGIPEVVVDGETGFLTRMYSQEDFLAAVRNLLADDRLRREMGQSAARHVRRHHDLDVNYRGMESVLASVASSAY